MATGSSVDSPDVGVRLSAVRLMLTRQKCIMSSF